MNASIRGSPRRVYVGDALELAYGKSLPEKARRSGPIPVYGSNGIVGWHDEALVTESCIVVGRKGAVGTVHLTDGPCFPIDTTYFVRIRQGFTIDLKYLAHALRSLQLDRLKIVVAVPGINREHVYREMLPYPPIDEQLKIVDLLSHAENIVRMRREAEQKAKEIIPALFREIGNGGDVFHIRELCELQNGRAFKESEWQATGVPIIRIQNLNDPDKPFNYYQGELPDRFAVRNGNVLLSWSGTPGTSFGCFLWDRGAGWLNQHIFRVDVDTSKVLPEFFVYRVNEMLSELVAKAQGAVGLRHITKAELSRLEMRLPSIARQVQILRKMDAAELIDSGSMEATAVAQKTFQSLLAGVFGENCT